MGKLTIIYYHHYNQVICKGQLDRKKHPLSGTELSIGLRASLKVTRYIAQHVPLMRMEVEGIDNHGIRPVTDPFLIWIRRARSTSSIEEPVGLVDSQWQLAG